MADQTAPTNDRIVDLLRVILSELETIRSEQRELAAALHASRPGDDR